MAAVQKTAGEKLPEGSNPSMSANASKISDSVEDFRGTFLFVSYLLRFSEHGCAECKFMV